MKIIQNVFLAIVFIGLALFWGVLAVDGGGNGDAPHYVIDAAVLAIAYVAYAFAFSVILQVVSKKYARIPESLSSVVGVFMITTGPLGWEWLHFRDDVYYLALIYCALTLVPMVYVFRKLNWYCKQNLNRILGVSEGSEPGNELSSAILFAVVGVSAYAGPLLLGGNSIFAIIK